MENASAILIDPFKNVLESLTSQLRPWGTIYNMINICIKLPSLNEEMQQVLNNYHIYDEPVGFTGFKAFSLDLAKEANQLFSSHHQTLRYPYLVGLWSIMEVAFDELILRILINDPEASTKLHSADIRVKTIYDIGSKQWATDALKQLEKSAISNSGGRVFEIHKNCLNPFGIILEYPEIKREYIEEINQYRNCILHRQGVIDEKAIKICPKLTPLLGMPINLSDEHFNYLLELLPNYLLAWIAALMYSPYLKSSLLPETKNPFKI